LTYYLEITPEKRLSYTEDDDDDSKGHGNKETSLNDIEDEV